jgi:hypothetical protein
MKFLEVLNRVMFTSRFSIFDLIWIVIIGTLANDNAWWFLLLIPATFISVAFERRFGDKE